MTRKMCAAQFRARPFILRQDHVLKSDRQLSKCERMVSRSIRLVFAIVIATLLVGAPTAQATIMMPCDTVVTSAPDHQLSSESVPIQTPVPCKGMMPGCADMLGCVVTAALPVHVTGAAHMLIWTSVAYRAVVGWHEGLSIKPYLGPPLRSDPAARGAR